jgi:hypothetical protein
MPAPGQFNRLFRLLVPTVLEPLIGLSRLSEPLYIFRCYMLWRVGVALDIAL